MLLPDSILRGREAVCPVAVVDNGAGQTLLLFPELARVAEEAEGRNTKWNLVTPRGFCFT